MCDPFQKKTPHRLMHRRLAAFYRFCGDFGEQRRSTNQLFGPDHQFEYRVQVTRRLSSEGKIETSGRTQMLPLPCLPRDRLRQTSDEFDTLPTRSLRGPAQYGQPREVQPQTVLIFP